jgi:hypothetical protein
MLELQLRYGCYNSARIDMAVDAGECGIDLMRKFLFSRLSVELLLILYSEPLYYRYAQ